jgi:hypothetical protein
VRDSYTGSRDVRDSVDNESFRVRASLLLAVREQEVPPMAQGQYERSALTTARTDETLRFDDVERDLFPTDDAFDDGQAVDAFDPWMASDVDRRPEERAYARRG